MRLLAAPLVLPGLRLRRSRAGVIDVRDFGARGDGAVDDTAAVIRALGAAVEGDTLWFPGPAAYLIDAVDLGRHGHAGLTLAGDADALLRKAPTGRFGGTNTEHLFFDARSDGASDGLTVRALAFDLSAAAARPGDTVSAFFLARADGLRFDACRFVDGIEEGLKLYACRDVEIVDCHFERLRNDGVQVHAPPAGQDGYTGPRGERGWRNVVIERSTFRAIDDGLGGVEGQGVTLNSRSPMVTCTGATVRDCLFERCVRGIWAEVNEPGARVLDLRIERNRVLESVTIGLGVVGVEDAVLARNEVIDPVGADARSDALAGIVVSGSSAPRPRSRRVDVIGNRILDRRAGRARMPVGIVVRQADDVRLRGNQVQGAREESVRIDRTARGVSQTP